VWSIGLGNPGAESVRRCHERGVRVIAMVATVEDARTVEASGVDAIVAQGGEAGGHRSTWTKRLHSEASVGTMVLVPQVVDAVKPPVIAAGGIADGRGVVAALALGASGAMLGTRFVACRESMAPPMYKQALLTRGSGDTAITDAFTGLHARTLRNAFVREYEEAGAPVLPSLLQSNAAEDIFKAAAQQENPEYFPMPSGESVGLIHDLPGAADIVRTIVREAQQTLETLSARRA
jgi:nitronate monooxygenase